MTAEWSQISIYYKHFDLILECCYILKEIVEFSTYSLLELMLSFRLNSKVFIVIIPIHNVHVPHPDSV